MRLPVVAIVGRPNVGKSALLNRLAHRQAAIVEDAPGMTRDRLYAECEWEGRRFLAVDTGGFLSQTDDPLLTRVRDQAQRAVREADLTLLVVDARQGVTPEDEAIAQWLRTLNATVLLVANKVEGPRQALDAQEFFALGLGEPFPVSALHGLGTGDLLSEILIHLPEEGTPEETPVARVAIVGRPNVGKSSLVNAIVGEERVIVDDRPGTTRDAVDTFLRRDDRPLALIDTAGLRRPPRVTASVERHSVGRALHAIKRADITVLVVDAAEGITDQERRIVRVVERQGCGLVVAVNKWDKVSDAPRATARARNQVREALRGAAYARIVFTSAAKGWGIAELLDAVTAAMESYSSRVGTGPLNRWLEEAEAANAPSANRVGRRVKILYATQAQTRPPTIILFVNDPTLMPDQYLRYLERRLRQALPLEGTPIRFQLRARRQREHGAHPSGVHPD
ncbi:MAG: ribosome biogenesis GTPase Der [Armatimonadetes bacterium]|nr:ribosome biogenesis GTPase Der [Armatimonadota bacterium]